MAVDSAEDICYQHIFQNAVEGSADAAYGISGKGSLQIRKAKNIGDWNKREGFEEGSHLSLRRTRQEIPQRVGHRGWL